METRTVYKMLGICGFLQVQVKKRFLFFKYWRAVYNTLSEQDAKDCEDYYKKE